MKLVCISDTHGKHTQLKIPPGDILIHAGDFSSRGRASEIAAFHEWFCALPHPHKIVIAGNHDFMFEQEPQQARTLFPHVTYLEDSGAEIRGLKFWGSPVTPRFFDWAFNRTRGADIARHWAMIAPQTEVLIVHGPPQGILDKVWIGGHVGCVDLKLAIAQIRPKMVIFGHIHEGYGTCRHDGILYINASSLNRLYQPTHPPIVVEWEQNAISVV